MQVSELAEFVRELQKRMPVDTQTVLNQLTEFAAQAVPGAQHAGITTISGEDLQTESATGPYPVVLDEIQRHHGEGPCLAAAREGHQIWSNHLPAGNRWPRYCSDALRQTPIRSIVAFRLFAHHGSTSALNFYAEQADAFAGDSVETGALVATYVALAWSMLRHDEQLRSALATRDLIGQATGILMEQFSLDAVDAVDLLVQLSQENNMELAHIAKRIVDLRARVTATANQ